MIVNKLCFVVKNDKASTSITFKESEYFHELGITKQNLWCTILVLEYCVPLFSHI